MRLPFYIARRYLFSPKSHQVINIISGVATAGVALATIAMVCTLSVFNGFQELVAQQFTALDPEIKITSARGKSFANDEQRIEQIKNLEQIEIVTQTIEDKAMVQYDGRQVMVTLKGVEDNFEQLTDIKKSLIGNGNFILHDSIVDYAIPGVGLISTLNCGVYFVEPLEIYAPKRGRKVNLTNPAANFKKGLLHTSGMTFVLNQPKYDDNYIITSIDFAREIFGREENEISSLELKLKRGYNVQSTKKDIKEILGDDYFVEDRYEQQDDIFRIMKIEKFISYIFLSFILLIACFNIIGSLSMLIIEKRRDVETLRSMGADNRLITNIFILEGSMISLLGAISGIIIGIAICLLQQYFGILGFGNAANGFIVDSYPVKLVAGDIFAILATVVAIGLLAVGVPVKLLTRRLLK